MVHPYIIFHFLTDSFWCGRAPALLLAPSRWAPLPISKVEAIHCSKETHFSHLNPQTHSFGRLCGSVGFVKPWSSDGTGTACSLVWSSQNEGQPLQVWGCGSQLEKGGMLTLFGNGSLSQVEEIKFLKILFTCNDNMEQEMDIGLHPWRRGDDPKDKAFDLLVQHRSH